MGSCYSKEMNTKKITWYKFKDSFEKFIVKDLEKALQANVEVGVIILTIIGIESLSGYFSGKNSDIETFKDFINEFMPSYSSHAETLYKCIRNGLLHDYIIKEHEGKCFLFTRNIGENHLQPVPNTPGWFYLNREQFARDFIKAQKDYFQRIEMDKKLQERAIHRLSNKGYLDVFSFNTEFYSTSNLPWHYQRVNQAVNIPCLHSGGF